MTAYATAAELASYLQQDVDTSTANVLLAAASAKFALLAGSPFTATTTTYTIRGNGGYQLWLPYRPIISVDAVRVAGVTVTDYTFIRRTLYRVIGFGSPWAYPPDTVAVDLTWGYASVPDDVKGAVLESCATAYVSPDNATVSEQIDDYAIRNGAKDGGLQLSDGAMDLARFYRGSIVA